jgi:hypothetical protein
MTSFPTPVDQLNVPTGSLDPRRPVRCRPRLRHAVTMALDRTFSQRIRPPSKLRCGPRRSFFALRDDSSRYYQAFYASPPRTARSLGAEASWRKRGFVSLDRLYVQSRPAGWSCWEKSQPSTPPALQVGIGDGQLPSCATDSGTMRSICHITLPWRGIHAPPRRRPWKGSPIC